ncbi:universal stress protein [Maritimibacter alkaliphilus]|nr:universal stress protein [Maritimibacter alkaliphilus]MBY6089746.1 universal stress protein [Maritimibacter alkaliphilus]
MFSKLMVPVDLTHADRLSRSLSCAADLARHYGAPIVYVGVTSPNPGSIAHNPAEYAEKLAAFAAAQATEFGHEATAHAITSHDPTIDLDRTLLKAVDEVGADLVVMASHLPNLTDYIWPSNGGTIAGHSKASVLVVRG